MVPPARVGASIVNESRANLVPVDDRRAIRPVHQPTR